MCIENARLSALETEVVDLMSKVQALESIKPRKYNKKKVKYVPFQVAYAAYKKGKRIQTPHHIVPYSLSVQYPDILDMGDEFLKSNEWIILD